MRKVLIIDDYLDNADTLKMLVGLIPGYEGYAAYNGHTGIEAARKLKPDYVMTDIQLPDMNGGEVASIIKQEFPEIVIVGMSGYTDISHPELFATFLTKPISLAILQEFLAGI